MDFVAQKGEIIIMDDESCYLVLKNIEFNNEAYLHVIKTGDYLFQEDAEISIKDEAYVKEVVENDECFYDFITDEALIEKLKTL